MKLRLSPFSRVVAGWAFRQILDDVMSAYPDDSDLAALLQEAEDFGYLHIGNLEPRLANRVTASITEVATKILNGTLPSSILERFNDGEMSKEYLKGLRALLDVARRSGIAVPGE